MTDKQAPKQRPARRCRWCGARYVGNYTYACGSMSCAGASEWSVTCHKREQARKVLMVHKDRKG